MRNNFGFWSLVIVLLKFLFGVVDHAVTFGRSSLVVLHHMNCMNSPYTSGETVRRTSKTFWNARTCSRSSITVPSLVGLRLRTPPGEQKMSRLLSVCPSVTLLSGKGCPDEFAQAASELRF